MRLTAVFLTPFVGLFFSVGKASPDESLNDDLSRGPECELHGNCRKARTCTLYMAESTIPGAGLGIFTAIDRKIGESIGNGDVLIPQVDLYYHQAARKTIASEDYRDPFEDYLWYGPEMGMQQESSHPFEYLSAFAPGLDAAINCHLGLVNVDKLAPEYDTMPSWHRAVDPGVGAITPYQNCSTIAKEFIPAGGELFKHYGDQWFTGRQDIFGLMPLLEDYPRAEQFAIDFNSIAGNTSMDFRRDLYKIVTDFPFESRVTNALPNDVLQVPTIVEEGIRAVYQPLATRKVEDLEANGRCLDYLAPRPSTLPQAGRGAFATQFLAEGTIVAGSPFLVMANGDYFDMFEANWYDKTYPPDISRKTRSQLGLNYCWTHADASLFLCPYGANVNYINHNPEPNIRVQWARAQSMRHNEQWLHQSATEMLVSSSPGLFLDFIALRDIEEGEEVFIDYGPKWELAWQAHVEYWTTSNYSHSYQSARVYSKANANKPFRSQSEQEVDPYPSYYEFRCLDVAWYNPKQHQNVWMLWNRTRTFGFNCRILEHRTSPEGTFYYKVELQAPLHKDVWGEQWDPSKARAETWYTRDSWFPQHQVVLVDLAYSTDIFLSDAFRHPIAIPDSIFPDAWRGFVA